MPSRNSPFNRFLTKLKLKHSSPESVGIVTTLAYSVGIVQLRNNVYQINVKQQPEMRSTVRLQVVQNIVYYVLGAPHHLGKVLAFVSHSPIGHPPMMDNGNWFMHERDGHISKQRQLVE